MATKVKEAKIDALIPDDLNANKGTEFGGHLIEKSLRTLGAGRSILIDKNNRIIAGNKTIENAASIGLENVLIVETTGDQIVAVKRMDVDLDSEKGRELALADNATAKANLAWDEDAIATINEKWKIEPENWGISLPTLSTGEDEPDPSELAGGAKGKPAVLKITFQNEKQLEQAQIEIQAILNDRFPNAVVSVSAGEL